MNDITDAVKALDELKVVVECETEGHLVDAVKASECLKCGKVIDPKTMNSVKLRFRLPNGNMHTMDVVNMKPPAFDRAGAIDYLQEAGPAPYKGRSHHERAMAMYGGLVVILDDNLGGAKRGQVVPAKQFAELDRLIGIVALRRLTDSEYGRGDTIDLDSLAKNCNHPDVGTTAVGVKRCTFCGKKGI